MTAERATINQIAQWGVEVTPGTAVPCNRILDAISLEPGIKLDLAQFTPQGRRFVTEILPGREWAEWKAAGKPDYAALTYVLASQFGIVTPTTVGTASKQWQWTPALTGAITPQTYTLQKGDAVRAEQAAFGFFTGHTEKITKQAADFDGSLLSQAITDGASLTASPTIVGLLPILPAHYNIYADTTSGGIGGTQLLRVLSAEFAHVDAYDVFYAINRAQSSFAGEVDKLPKPTLKLLLEADANGMTYLSGARLGSKYYLRVDAQGALLPGETTTHAEYKRDLCAEVSDIAEWKDDQGVYCIEYTFTATEDPAWNSGQAIQYTLVNQVASL